ncbi:hypothetical protein OB2597_14846 [Pseudooceanicola batsensis HTCC2597]|uniref:Uncharacterized protein n=1 Tax=Pseudooceanicola batsensis (strain ATCC BAA-863 / DSM 15984 / KCTC 12145 / HTCC2597) TaxID=252305 RepID=A3U2D1_PSEBH|nr:hypothetical protein [Pseudooceanicola batsensis]EAQ01731.1 hypothetical protein OB2597_14846 [Pseudooceanicola batsensis HTCC2597]
MTGPRTDRAERIVPAAPARLSGRRAPDGARAEVAARDRRTGGDVCMVRRFLSGGDGNTGPARDEVAGRFAEGTPPESLARSIRVPAANPAFAGPLRMHRSFSPHSHGTRVRVASHGVPAGKLAAPAAPRAVAPSQGLAKLSALFAAAPTSKETT